VVDPSVRFWTRVSKGEACWLWTGGQTGGSDPQRRYGQFWAGRNGGHVYAHRFSWELHRGQIADGLLVLHRCDVTLCVNPEHLFLGTQLDNMQDMARKGRAAFGERNGVRKHPERVSRGAKHSATIRQGDEHWTRTAPDGLARGDEHWTRRLPGALARGEQSGAAKLTEDQVREIRRLAAEGWSQPKLGRRFGVVHATVGRIIRGKGWSHVR
jgi:hypothetical protein